MDKRITFIYNSSINLKSIKYFLKKLKNVEYIRLKDFQYNKSMINENNIILYQTFPDNSYYQRGDLTKSIKYNEIERYEGETHPKFVKMKIERSDFKFLNLPNKLKILVDLHDDPDEDGFERFINHDYPFKNKNIEDLVFKLGKKYFYNFPRIKHCPGYNFKERYNVIFDLHCYTKKIKLNLNNFYNRDKIIHYSCSDINNKIRPLIKKKLVENKNKDFLNLNPLKNYIDSLKNIYVEVNAPGWGRACYRNVETLKTGCLLFVYDDFKDFDIIPNTKLIENKDYISFNLDNLDEKIDFILNNEKIVNQIRMNGYNKFIKNYDLDKRALEFKNIIEKF